jgi:hypothetical protein
MSPFNPPGYRSNIRFFRHHNTDRLQSMWSVLSAQTPPCSTHTCCSFGRYSYMCVCWYRELCILSSDEVFRIRFSPILPSCLHPPSSYSARESACGGSSYEILRCLLGRRVAIWKRNLVISAIAVAVWLISIAFYIRSTYRIFTAEVWILELSTSRDSDGTVLSKLRSALLLRLFAQTMSIWSSGSSFCGTLYSGRNINPIVILVADSVLLVLMLSGLRRHGGLGVVGTWRLLYRQVSGPLLYTHRNVNGCGIGFVVARSDHRRRNTFRCMYPFVLSDANV